MPASEWEFLAHASCPWPSVRTSRYHGHSGRRPPSLSASLCRAPPPLSSSSGTESLTAPPKDAFHSPRLCRVAVFLIQTNVSLQRTFRFTPLGLAFCFFRFSTHRIYSHHPPFLCHLSRAFCSFRSEFPSNTHHHHQFPSMSPLGIFNKTHLSLCMCHHRDICTCRLDTLLSEYHSHITRYLASCVFRVHITPPRVLINAMGCPAPVSDRTKAHHASPDHLITWAIDHNLPSCNTSIARRALS